jgi:predicted nucleic acid-binding protein
MSDRVFIDTNIFVYADDQAAKLKRPRAREVLSELIRERRAVVSTQVMQEYFVTAIKKLGLPADRARARVEALHRLDVVVVRAEHVLGAIDLHRLQSISFWDALIVKCASSAGCGRLLTEDLSDGQVIDGVTVENPF